MSEFIVKKVSDIPKMINPLLIEGLPGIGNVARLSVDYLIDKLKAKKIYEIYSDVFPNSVTINDESVIEMFRVELFYVKVEGKDLLFLAGDVQPTSNQESYALCWKVIELVKELGVKELITIGGIGLPENPSKSAIHVVLSEASVKNKLKGLDVVFDGSDTVKVILGVTGLLLGLAGLNGFKGFSLLAETFNDPSHIGVKESREILKVLVSYLDIKIDFKDLDNEIKSFEQEIKDENLLSDKIKKELVTRQGYIG